MNKSLMQILTVLSIGIIAFVAVISIYQTKTEARDWSAYYNQHGCHLVKKSESFTVYNPGKGSMTFPERSTYACDNNTILIER